MGTHIVAGMGQVANFAVGAAHGVEPRAEGKTADGAGAVNRERKLVGVCRQRRERRGSERAEEVGELVRQHMDGAEDGEEECANRVRVDVDRLVVYVADGGPDTSANVVQLTTVAAGDVLVVALPREEFVALGEGEKAVLAPEGDRLAVERELGVWDEGVRLRERGLELGLGAAGGTVSHFGS